MRGWVDRRELQDPATILAQSPFRILLVEDDEIQMVFSRGMLEAIFGEKLDVDWVTSCSEAIERLNTREYEICLLDYMVEGGDARDILSRVNFGLVNTPVIVVSAHDGREFILEALRYGADDYVVKGQFRRVQLEQAIQYAVFRKHKELVLRQRALYDPLTQLANRHLLLDRLGEVHRFSARYDEVYALMVVDLDKLKPVNDQFGHDAGDRYLKAAADAMIHSMRASDTVARVGGDEFVAILKNIRDKQNMLRICAAVCAGVAAHTPEPGMTFTPSCSIGVAVFPTDAGTVDELMQKADAAMYEAKRAGGNGFRFA